MDEIKRKEDRGLWMIKHVGITPEFKERVKAAAEAEGKGAYQWIFETLEAALKKG